MWRHLRSAVSIRLQPNRECSAIKSEIGHPLSVICCIKLAPRTREVRARLYPEVCRVLLRLRGLWRQRLDRKATSHPPLSLSLKVTPRLISPGTERSFRRFAAPFRSLAALRHAVGL